jgi:hypothetical protein
MEQSILRSTKKALHVSPDDDSFDLDVVTQINSAFSTLNDLGVGPEDGFIIEDDAPVWEDFLSGDKVQISQIKTFVTLKSRLGFDPPAAGFLLTAIESQIQELVTRISMRRENAEWTPPVEEVVDVIDGGDAG